MHALTLGIGFGLVTAAVLAISAVGLSLQFSVTNFPNFAHGELMTIGAYGSLTTYKITHNAIVACVASIVAGALAGALMNRVVFVPFRRRKTVGLTLFVLTIGISLVLQNGVLWLYGSQTVRLPFGGGAPHHLGPFLLTTDQLMVIAGAIVIMLGVHLLLNYTLFGKAQRAVAESPTLAEASGVSSERVINSTWFLTGGLAGLSGFILALTTGSLTPTLGFNFLLIVFAAAILGGIGQPYGAMAGALVVGVAMEVAAVYIRADYKTTVAFALLILALILRPQGLIPAKRMAAA